jgi:hypothetical protein
LYTLGDENERFNVEETHELLPDEKRGVNDSIGHGTEVLRILYSLLPEASFHLYRITDEYEEDGFEKSGFYQSSAIQAFEKARKEDVDILHFSNGIPEPKEGDVEWFESVVETLVESGTSLVASAGNASKFDAEEERDEVFHPARYKAVISVGGYTDKCSGVEDPRGCRGHWLELKRYDQLQGPYCSWDGCTGIEDCSSNRVEKRWPQNVSAVNGKPEVYAPVQHLSFSEQDYPALFMEGTSYASPYVTGLLGRAVCAGQVQPTPGAMLDALEDAAVSLEDDDGKKIEYSELVPQPSESGAML